MSRAEIATALASMPPRERAAREAQFTSNRYVVVSYNRVVRSFDRRTGRPMGLQETLAAGQSAPVSTSSIDRLYISIAVAYDREAPPNRWDITDYFDWTGSPPNNCAGKDQLATAWANGSDGIALNSDWAYGYYTNGKSISMNRNDMTPNVGTSWEFLEQGSSQCIVFANWGYLLATIKENTRHYKATNVVFKYFHTFENLNYSISFNASGPSISISPAQSTSSTAVYASFND